MMDVPVRSRLHVMWKTLGVAAVLAMLAGAVEVAKGGHEAAVYPSYYPHEIKIETISPEYAASLLRDNKIAAYVGGAKRFPAELPPPIRNVASLGDFVVVRINPASPLAKSEAQACDATEAVVRDMAGRTGFTFHPYPVTPFHGDYLYHADRAAAAKARILSTSSASRSRDLTVRAEGALGGLVRAEWRSDGPDWDVGIEAVGAARLVAAALTTVNGWLGPPWLKTGWFQTVQLLGDTADSAATRQQVDALLTRLETGEYRDTVERLNLQRELVAVLAGGCSKVVAGYTVKREYFSAEFTEGVENIGFDAITGLDSPMFVRTVKLKNFPWNGWLALGIDGQPKAAWNPIAGFNDAFGRLLWSALGDPALLPAPYDSGWMLNRLSDVQAKVNR
jgi:hypothetical protein